MRTKSILLAGFTALLAALSSCGDKTESSAFTTDSVKCEQKTNTTEVSIYADYPTGGDKALCNAVSEYISEALGGTYEGPLANGDTVVAYYAKATNHYLDSLYDEGGDPEMPAYSHFYKIEKAVDVPNFVTYTCSSEVYLGGAHGSHYFEGVTFRKSDGRRFGMEMLHHTYEDEFLQLLKEGVKDYFAEQGEKRMTDEELMEELLTVDDVNYMPLPKSTPYIDKDGIVFTYQPYEIAPYAAGVVKFTVPFSKIAPYLTATVKKLIAQ